MSELRYRIEGLDCPHCAARLEGKLKRIEGVGGASVDLSQGLILLSAKEGLDDLTEAIQRAADEIEKGLFVRAIEGEDGTGGEEEGEEESPLKDRLVLGAAALAFALGLCLPQAARPFCFVIAWLLAGLEVLEASFRLLKGFALSLFRRPVVSPLDENLLMAVATVGALALGDFAEGALVMLLFNLGEQLQAAALRRSRASIGALLAVRPDHANLVLGEEVRRVLPSAVRAGDVIELRPGERVPLDGVVLAGRGSVDTRDMTGESLPREAYEGVELLAGFINQSGLLRLRVSRVAEESALSRSLNRIRDAVKGRARAERFFTRFAKVYTPIVVLLAALLTLVPPLFLGDFSQWLYRALSFLVISCPCALVLSIPLSFFCGIGAASRRGLLCKGGAVLEQLAKVDSVAFDKTGTLTLGQLRVGKISPQGDLGEEELLALAASAERASDHPIAKIIAAAAPGAPSAARVEELAGRGLRAELDGETLLVGNARLLGENGVAAPELEGSGVLVAKNGRYLGSIELEDSLHPDAKGTIEALRERGVRNIALLSGDTKAVARGVAGALGIQVRGELLPDEKVEALEALPGRVKAYVGDGVNDAPCLLAADVGVAIGLSGADSAIEAADLVLLQGSPKGLVRAKDIARATMANVKQNAAFALGVKALFLALAALGLAGMWLAVFADVGVTLLCVLNALRLLGRGRGRA
ncbi:MAG: cadmium-translocating P-type ATPase [Christensenellaceae bacterium]|jgi:Cd2+/Zn2+-exporting ATPase|nr:cadmium-translocating P-type ATPase [Christensenellaceae bacterium]